MTGQLDRGTNCSEWPHLARHADRPGSRIGGGGVSTCTCMCLYLTLEICLYKPWRVKFFFSNNHNDKYLIWLFPLHLNTMLPWLQSLVYGHHRYFTLSVRGSTIDVTFWPLNVGPALKGLAARYWRNADSMLVYRHWPNINPIKFRVLSIR